MEDSARRAGRLTANLSLSLISLLRSDRIKFVALFCSACFVPLMLNAGNCYKFDGIAIQQCFYPKAGSTNLDFDSLEKRGDVSAGFSLTLDLSDGRWFLRVNWKSNTFSESGFDLTNLYLLLKSPIRNPLSSKPVDWDHPTVILIPSSTGVPETAHPTEKFLWLALASGKFIGDSEHGDQKHMSVPWSAPKGVMPEIDCFDWQAECFGDELHSPRNAKFIFSKARWKSEYPTKLPIPFTNGTPVGLYQVLETTNYEGLTVPVKFLMTRRATGIGWLLEKYIGQVTNMTKVAATAATFQPAPVSYRDGVTVHDNRFTNKEAPSLVFSYNITNQLYPGTNAGWLQPLVKSAQVDWIRRDKLARFSATRKKVAMAAVRFVLAMLFAAPIIFLILHQKKQRYNHQQMS